MAFGTILRILISIFILILPGYLAYTNNIFCVLFYILDIILIPLIIRWEIQCDCEGCVISNYCSKQKKINFIKTIMSFLGYDKEKLNNINYTCENDYFDIYKLIKIEYQK